MSNIIATIKALPGLLPLASASQIEISDAEIQLCLRFADEYRVYLAEFGAVLADGVELTGIAKSKRRHVVTVTKQEWESNLKVPHSMYVIENVAIEGIIIWQDSNGEVYQSTPNKEPIKIADSMVKYLSQK